MNKKREQSYATITDDGVNYRDIARTMTLLKFPMFHSSARNYVLRVMTKFVEAYAKKWNIPLTEEKVHEIAKSPLFQSGISDLLHSMWGAHDDDALFMQKDDQEKAHSEASAD